MAFRMSEPLVATTEFVLVYIILHICVNKNVCLLGRLDDLMALAEKLNILREPNDIYPNDVGGMEPTMVHSSSILLVADRWV
jgi:hypothetical protein